MQPAKHLLIITGLLLLIVGPCFGPLPRYLAARLSLEAASVWLIASFLLALSLLLAVMYKQMRSQGLTLADLGWRQPSRPLALVLGTGLGLLWGSFGVMGFVHFQPDADPRALSLLRVGTAIVGALIAAGEDLLTRGYVMHQLRCLHLSPWAQVVGSACLFALYHSLWSLSLPGFVASLIYGLILGGLFMLGKRSLTPVILSHSLAALVGEPFLTMSLILAAQGGR